MSGSILMGGEIPALSVLQPWAWAIVHAGKDVENRRWWTTHKGLLLIHASASKSELAGAMAYESVGRPWNAAGVKLPGTREERAAKIVFGAIVGVVMLSGWSRACKSVWAEDGMVHWHLWNARAFPRPIPCRGALNLWRPPPEVMAAAKAQMEELGVVGA